MAINVLNVAGGGTQLTGGDGIEIAHGVVTNTATPPAIVLDNTINDPASVTDFGGVYIVPAGATGAWAGQTGRMATSLDLGVTWDFAVPVTGTRHQIVGGPNAGVTVRWSGTAWEAVPPAMQAVGSVLKITAFQGTQLVESGSSTDRIWALPAYTPVSAQSFLLIKFDGRYGVGGNNGDAFESYIRNGSTVLSTRQQQFVAAMGGGTRSGVMLPHSTRFTNNGLAAKTFNIRMLRIGGDDTLFTTSDRYGEIVEIQR